MKTKIFYVIVILIFALSSVGNAQTIGPLSADSILRVNGEVYFKFALPDHIKLDTLTRIISIDNVKDGEVFAYANTLEYERFLQLQIPITVLPSPGSLLNDEELNMGNWQKNSDNMTIWNFYPTYTQYVTIMTGFASSYPSICKLDTIGTTIQGRLLLALKISDSVNYDRGAPKVFLTSSIHGDEITGYVLMLHLIDTLLNAYGVSPRLTNMVNKTQIYINPLANPDGTYRGGDASVSGAIRGNANTIDMNRNYPDPRAGQHPDGNMWQPEVILFMNYAKQQRFNLSINFHGGAEVVNYPWDTWNSSQKITADDSWWQFVSHEYADTAQHFGPSGYFTDVDPSGVTNGGDWYIITGGRQDYHNYFMHCREVTLEISVTKNPSASNLMNFWKYNYRSFFNYIEQANYGIDGKIYDSLTFAPIAGKVLITTHDADSSFIYSTLPSGWYFRMIDNGPWAITYSAPGYYSRTISGIGSTRYLKTVQYAKLRPIDIYFPRSFQAVAINGNQINLSWSQNAQNDPVMIAYNTTGTFGTPVNGTVYAPGSSITGGGIVIYNGSATQFPHTCLSPNTVYYYRSWSVKSGNNYSSPALAVATTLCGGSSSFPFTENFTTATAQLPDCWSQESLGANYITSSWSRVNSNNAGGSAWEMRSSRQASSLVTSGTLRLKTFFFNTVGIPMITLNFRHMIDARSTGVTFKVQSSTDGINWTDESWSSTPGSTNVPATLVTLNITNNLNSPSTMIAFVITGNPRNYDYWYIDDVSIKAPGYWVGGTLATPTDWNTTTNWGDGIVPTSTTNAYIPLRTYLPVVFTTPATPCNNLTIEKDARVTINPGQTLNVNGNMILKAP